MLTLQPQCRGRINLRKELAQHLDIPKCKIATARDIDIRTVRGFGVTTVSLSKSKHAQRIGSKAQKGKHSRCLRLMKLHPGTRSNLHCAVASTLSPRVYASAVGYIHARLLQMLAATCSYMRASCF